jgi:prevent-host-death family protein
MVTAGVVEARNNFSALLDRVEQGEAVIITRRGVPVARLVPDSSQDALQRMRARASQIRTGPFDWDGLKRDRDLGRP